MPTHKPSRLLSWYRLPISIQEAPDFLLLSLAEQGMLFALWKCYWQGGCKGLPADPKSLQKVSKLPPKRLLLAAKRLAEFFRKEDSLLRCDWLDEEYRVAMEFSKLQQDKINKRWKTQDNSNDTPVHTPVYSAVDTVVIPVLDRIGSDSGSPSISESLSNSSFGSESSGGANAAHSDPSRGGRFLRNFSEPDPADHGEPNNYGQRPTDIAFWEMCSYLQQIFEKEFPELNWEEHKQSFINVYRQCLDPAKAFNLASQSLQDKRSRHEPIENEIAYLLGTVKAIDHEA